MLKLQPVVLIRDDLWFVLDFTYVPLTKRN